MTAAFIPATAPRFAVARDGAHAVIVDGVRAAVIRIADRRASGIYDGESICELALPAGDLAWIGGASRLVLVSATDAHTEVRLIDPFDGGRRVAEIRLDSAMRLGASNGTHALLLGARTAAILAGGETITPYQFLARTLPLVVGVAGTQFVAALPGTIEEWDPASRMPKRRLRLPRVAPITSLGGSERVLWMTTTQEPNRLEVLPLVNRGQPKAHELPEPIAAVSGHPSTDAVICIGAETGRVYAIDLDGRSRLRTIALPGIDRADAAALVVRGAALSVIAAQTGRPIATAVIEGSRELELPSPSLPAIIRSETKSLSSLYEEEPIRPRTVAEALRRPSTNEPDPPAARTITEALRKSSLAEVEASVPEESPARSIAEALRRRSDSEPPASVAIHEPPRTVTPQRTDAPRTLTPQRPDAPRTLTPQRTDAPRTITPQLDAVEITAPPVPDGPAAPRTISEAIRWDQAPATEPLALDNELVVPRQATTTTAWSEGASELMAKLAALRAQRDGAPDAPQRATWRDDAGAWARAVASGTFDRAAPSCPPIDILATRFELPSTLLPALVLLYGSHLAGMQGAAPMDVAKVLGRRWDEALGRGKLAELGLAVHADSRVRLAPVILHVLDELAPSGELIGEPGTVGLAGPTLLISREPIRVIGVRVVEQLGGAVLLGSYVDALALALEARALGALAVAHVEPVIVPHHPILIVVGDDRAAEQIDLPRFELAPPGH